MYENVICVCKKVRFLKFRWVYLNEKVLRSYYGGCSDITLQNKNDKTNIFISSKYPKSNEDIQKSVDYHDIQNIISQYNLRCQSKVY
jgi:hypothetical protein